MNLEKLREAWKKEEQVFRGWDFSYLDGRWESAPLPWDYKEIVLKYLKPDSKLLDMGTGGGEFLLSLGHPHSLTSVTEAYPPNVELCKKNLAPLGIRVRQIFDDREIPYDTDEFDLVINRHESFDAREVRRVLKNGGYFITQQVGGKNNNDLSEKIIEGFEPGQDHDLKSNTKLLEEAGFKIIFSDESFPKLKFFDIGALVYLAKIIEWEFPGFSVDSCFDNLCKLEKELNEKGFISCTEHRFVIVALNRKY
ncbi:MAG: class I SAM-dependent methyltransferase [Halanaerobiaceae bacterium]|nr:class I SAM-dependent methyltransferase [Halanaerobiaceae bacterium]